MFTAGEPPPRLMRVEVMFMVITEMETGEQRQPTRIIITARIVMITKIIAVFMGEIGSEVKELKGR